MKPETRLRRNPALIATAMDGELVMLDVAKGSYYGLNPVGAHLWHLLEKEQGLEDLVASVEAHFEMGAEDVRTDLGAFVEDMIKNGLIETLPCSGPFGENGEPSAAGHSGSG